MASNPSSTATAEDTSKLLANAEFPPLILETTSQIHERSNDSLSLSRTIAISLNGSAEKWANGNAGETGFPPAEQTGKLTR